MEKFTWNEILTMDLQKNKLADKIGIECAYDTALPQTWLNNFVDYPVCAFVEYFEE